MVKPGEKIDPDCLIRVFNKLIIMQATIITQAPLRLITARSKTFPAGNRAAFDAIESQLDSLRGRKFYGLVYPTENNVDYYAGLVPQSDTEELAFKDSGFDIKVIDGGPCARIKLHDWSSKTDQIGPAFATMINQYGFDPLRPQMEFYRSLSELHLLLPIPEQSALKQQCEHEGAR